MKLTFTLLFLMLLLSSCQNKNLEEKININGTWQLISAETIEKDSTFSTFNPKNKMIKIINDNHFAFFNHDLNKGQKADSLFFGGGGKYTLVDSTYTEYLEFFNNRDWENNKFSFTVKVSNDTLTQKGVEKIENLGINRIIIEKYIRLK
jgi:hypothetical protein